MKSRNLSEIKRTFNLIERATGFHDRGYRIFPLRDSSKQPAVAWGQYRKRAASQKQISRWFGEGGHANMAIITGSASHLCVADFDDLAWYELLVNEFPALARTFTVSTRRGLHLHYHLAPGDRIPSRKLPGLDILGEGRYVVAPGSIVHGHEYRVLVDEEPLYLVGPTAFEFERFLARVDEESRARHKPQEGSFSCEIESLPAFVGSADLVAYYRHHATKGSRNTALFESARLARDTGWQAQAVVDTLTELYITQPPNGPHAAETTAQRQREATATIASAFSRPPQPRKQGRAVRTLPNSVREAFFQMGYTNVVRVLDGLALQGVPEGAVLDRPQILDLLRGVVGRNSIDAALKATYADGSPVFGSPPTPPSTDSANADIEPQSKAQQNAILLGCKNREKPQGGRPRHQFIVPHHRTICAKLGVAYTFSDPVSLEDLASVRTTRARLAAEFIRRRPGQYPVTWLAERLSVCERTLQSYHLEFGVRSRPMYTLIPISWHNLDQLPPPEFEMRDRFIVDGASKKYPPLEAIAKKLLNQKQPVTLKIQTYNLYWHPNGIVPHVQAPVEHGKAVEVSDTHAPLDYAALLPPVEHTPTQQPSAPPEAALYAAIPPSYPNTRLADRVYDQINRLAPDERKISRANAQRLIETYGERAVEKALDRMWALHKKRKYPFSNPAGFLIVNAKMYWRELNGADRLGAPAPRFRGVKGRGGDGPEKNPDDGTPPK